jgi:hypothetical protein
VLSLRAAGGRVLPAAVLEEGQRSETMKKLLLILGLLALPVLGQGADNRGRSPLEVADIFLPVDNTYKVRFSTTVAANTNVVILSTMTLNNLVATSGISYSPSIASSTTTTYGGRLYSTFQIVSATGNVHVDFDTVDISSTTSPYLTQGQWFSADDPLSHQGPVVLRGTTQFTVTGWIWFHRKR